MTVRVADRGSGKEYVGVTVRTVEISAKCPKCGGLRGTATISPYRFHEDGEWYVVDTWANPCGHVDLYTNVLAEARWRRGGEAA
ncbi:hypothetical protein [Streptomyces sp. NPDC057557]|uniref:hypothetical protein n=1 Tax=Streptomyces sp. NPDC057557 TaxID=3346167 RepID=UPI0036BE9D92